MNKAMIYKFVKENEYFSDDSTHQKLRKWKNDLSYMNKLKGWPGICQIRLQRL